MLHETQTTGYPSAVLVALFDKGGSPEGEASLLELERLLETAGGQVKAKMVQHKDSADRATYIGSGKAEELRDLCRNEEIQLAIFDCELAPSQIRNLEKILAEVTKSEGEEDGESEPHSVRVIDRSMLILDIFALHAHSGEGKLQVELAQLKYTAPRLTGRGTEMSRLAGGIGTRGPGESKLEMDRRKLRERAAILEAQIVELQKNRDTQRKQRDRSDIMQVAIAGYTNAGKSTLLNRLTGAGVLAEDKLFATLDPTTRKFALPNGIDILLTDTVGFIRNLPHHLIKAFRSTLEEVALADLIIILADASDPEVQAQLEVTRELITELGGDEASILYVMNKCDAAHGDVFVEGIANSEILRISAKTGMGEEELIARLVRYSEERKGRATLLIPNDKQHLLNQIYRDGSVLSTDYTDEGIRVEANLSPRAMGVLREWVVR